MLANNGRARLATNLGGAGAGQKFNYPVGFAKPRHRAVRSERNGVSVNASVERRESISNASMLVSPRSLCQNALHTLPFLARRGKRDKRKNVIFLRFRSLKKGHRNFKQILEK